MKLEKKYKNNNNITNKDEAKKQVEIYYHIIAENDA